MNSYTIYGDSPRLSGLQAVRQEHEDQPPPHRRPNQAPLLRDRGLNAQLLIAA